MMNQPEKLEQQATEEMKESDRLTTANMRLVSAQRELELALANKSAELETMRDAAADTSRRSHEMKLELTITSRCFYFTTEQWEESDNPEAELTQLLEPGDRVEYVSHLIGGMIRVRRNGKAIIINPSATKELK